MTTQKQASDFSVRQQPLSQTADFSPLICNSFITKALRERQEGGREIYKRKGWRIGEQERKGEGEKEEGGRETDSTVAPVILALWTLRLGHLHFKTN